MGASAFPTAKALQQALTICIGVCALTAIWPNRGAPFMQVLMGFAFFLPILSAPFLILFFGGRKLAAAHLRRVVLGCMGLALIWWLWAFGQTYIWPERIDAQAGLVFLFAPLYSAIGAAVVNLLVRRADGAS